MYPFACCTHFEGLQHKHCLVPPVWLDLHLPLRRGSNTGAGCPAAPSEAGRREALQLATAAAAAVLFPGSAQAAKGAPPWTPCLQAPDARV